MSAKDEKPKIGIIINKKAKNSAKATPYLEGLTQAGIQFELYKTNPKKLEETIKLCAGKYSTLLVGGGDGTIRTAAHHCANTAITLGVLPLGTLNHFAHELELPLTEAELVKAILSNKTTCIDLAEVNGLVFINNSSLGFYPKFAKKRDFYTKKYNKWLSYIPGFINAFSSHNTYSLTIKSKGLSREIRTSFLMISNNLYSYEFPSTIKRESFKKKTLGLYFFKHGKLRLFKILRYFFNRRKNFEIIESKNSIEIMVANQKKISISLDGDTVSTTTPLIYKTLPKSLNLLVRKS